MAKKKDLAYYRALPYRRDVRFVTDDEDAESPYFVAEYRELPGCFTVGNSRSEALANLKDVFDEWIEAKLEWGSAIPEPERLGRGNIRRGGISIA